MVIAVRRDLKMGRGKVAAQCAHAAVDLYRQLSQQSNPLLVPSPPPPIPLPSSCAGLLIRGFAQHQWEANGEAKIVVGVENAEELMALVTRARVPDGASAGAVPVASTIISDAGRTQVRLRGPSARFGGSRWRLWLRRWRLAP